MFTNPLKNLKTLGLKENDIVADLGAGTGFYSIAAGTLVQQGKVYAVEINKDYLTTIKNKALDARYSNVECFLGNIEKLGGTQIANNVVDAVIASNVLFQVEDKDGFIEEVKRILKPSGKVLLIDWETGSAKGSFKESKEHLFVLGLKTAVPKDKAREKFEQKGFIWQRDIDAGEHHYGMILCKGQS